MGRGAARRDRGRGVAQGVRSFLAIELGDEARREAAGVAAALRAQPRGDSVRWVRAENLHVTLRFLGDVAPQRFPPLLREVAAALRGFAPFAVRLAALALFPSPLRPRVVALELAPFESIADLGGAVERGVVAAGFEPEARALRVHLTLGRIRGRYALPKGAPAPRASAFEVREVVLFASELSPAGPSYTPLERLALGSDVHPETPVSGGT